MHEILLPASRLIRMRNSYQHPDRATIAARLPLLGRRVPMRAFWRRRSVRQHVADRAIRRAEPLTTPAITAAARVKAGVTATASRTAAAARTATSAVSAARGELRNGRPPRREALRRALPAVASGAIIGALAMYCLDPRNGRRRRALMRDKLAHMRHIFTRHMPHTIERRGRFFAGIARGARHEAAELLVHDDNQPVDDETLVARVRSEALRDERFKAGEIHLDAFQGCVTLRGQLEHPDDIRRLVERAKRVEGVREVRSYLHLPGTTPPNKAQVHSTLPT